MTKRVLLIEDEPNIVEALRFILSRDGWIVDTHTDGATALEEIEIRNPDIIILDVMLPNKSGFEIMGELRKHTELGEKPVLMLTARGQEQDRERAAALGVTHFMTKPFANDDLLKTIRDLSS